MRLIGRFIAATLLLGLVSSMSAAGEMPPVPNADAFVTLRGGLVSAGIGYEWGRGTVTFQGNRYEFCIRGLSIGEVGAADIRAEGVIFHMSSLDDFPGKYSAVSVGAALIKGESTAMLKNRRGVTLQMDSRVTGLRFNISASGVRISLAGTRGCPESQTIQR
jgi:hypothetical protein